MTPVKHPRKKIRKHRYTILLSREERDLLELRAREMHVQPSDAIRLWLRAAVQQDRIHEFIPDGSNGGR